jgi:hypothetical protein
MVSEKVAGALCRENPPASESDTMRRRILVYVALMLAAPGSPQTSGESASAADEGEDHGRVFGRVDAPGLCAERESSEKY